MMFLKNKKKYFYFITRIFFEDDSFLETNGIATFKKYFEPNSIINYYKEKYNIKFIIITNVVEISEKEFNTPYSNMCLEESI
jgi:hypothetical protein